MALVVKNLSANAGDVRDRVPSLCWEDAREEEMETPFSILPLENPMDRGAWWATVHRVAQSTKAT